MSNKFKLGTIFLILLLNFFSFSTSLRLKDFIHFEFPNSVLAQDEDYETTFEDDARGKEDGDDDGEGTKDDDESAGPRKEDDSEDDDGDDDESRGASCEEDTWTNEETSGNSSECNNGIPYYEEWGRDSSCNIYYIGLKAGNSSCEDEKQGEKTDQPDNEPECDYHDTVVSCTEAKESCHAYKDSNGYCPNIDTGCSFDENTQCQWTKSDGQPDEAKPEDLPESLPANVSTEACPNKDTVVEDENVPGNSCPAVTDCRDNIISVNCSEGNSKRVAGWFGVPEDECTVTGDVRDVIRGSNDEQICQAQIDSCGNETVIEGSCNQVKVTGQGSDEVFLRNSIACSLTCNEGEHCEIGDSLIPACVKDPVVQAQVITEEACNLKTSEASVCGEDKIERQYGYVWNQGQCLETLISEKPCSDGSQPASGAAPVADSTEQGIKLESCLEIVDPVEFDACYDKIKQQLGSGQKIDPASLYRASLTLIKCSEVPKAEQSNCEVKNNQTRELAKILETAKLEYCNEGDSACNLRNDKVIKFSQYQTRLGVEECEDLTDKTAKINCQFGNYTKNKIAEAASEFVPDKCPLLEQESQIEACEDTNKQRYSEAVNNSLPFIGETKLGATCGYTEACSGNEKKACVGKVENDNGVPVCKFAGICGECTAGAIDFDQTFSKLAQTQQAPVSPEQITIDPAKYFSQKFEDGEVCRQVQTCKASDGSDGEQVCGGKGAAGGCDLSQGGGVCSPCQAKGTVKLNLRASCNRQTYKCEGAPALEGCMSDDECKPVYETVGYKTVGGPTNVAAGQNVIDGYIYQSVKKCETKQREVIRSGRTLNEQSTGTSIQCYGEECSGLVQNFNRATESYEECIVQNIPTGVKAQYKVEEIKREVSNYTTNEIAYDAKAQTASTANERYLQYNAQLSANGINAGEDPAVFQKLQQLNKDRIEAIAKLQQVENQLNIDPATQLTTKFLATTSTADAFLGDVGKRAEVIRTQQEIQNDLAQAQRIRLQTARSLDYNPDPVVSANVSADEDPLYRQKIKEVQEGINRLKELGIKDEVTSQYQQNLQQLPERTDSTRATERIVEGGTQMANLLNAHASLNGQTKVGSEEIAFLQQGGTSYVNQLKTQGGSSAEAQANALEAKIGDAAYRAWMGEYKQQFDAGVINPETADAITKGLNTSADQVAKVDPAKAQDLRVQAEVAPEIFAAQYKINQVKQQAEANQITSSSPYDKDFNATIGAIIEKVGDGKIAADLQAKYDTAVIEGTAQRLINQRLANAAAGNIETDDQAIALSNQFKAQVTAPLQESSNSQLASALQSSFDKSPLLGSAQGNLERAKQLKIEQVSALDSGPGKITNAQIEESLNQARLIAAALPENSPQRRQIETSLGNFEQDVAVGVERKQKLDILTQLTAMAADGLLRAKQSESDTAALATARDMYASLPEDLKQDPAIKRQIDGIESAAKISSSRATMQQLYEEAQKAKEAGDEELFKSKLAQARQVFGTEIVATAATAPDFVRNTALTAITGEVNNRELDLGKDGAIEARAKAEYDRRQAEISTSRWAPATALWNTLVEGQKVQDCFTKLQAYSNERCATVREGAIVKAAEIDSSFRNWIASHPGGSLTPNGLVVIAGQEAAKGFGSLFQEGITATDTRISARDKMTAGLATLNETGSLDASLRSAGLTTCGIFSCSYDPVKAIDRAQETAAQVGILPKNYQQLIDAGQMTQAQIDEAMKPENWNGAQKQAFFAFLPHDDPSPLKWFAKNFPLVPIDVNSGIHYASGQLNCQESYGVLCAMGYGVGISKGYVNTAGITKDGFSEDDYNKANKALAQTFPGYQPTDYPTLRQFMALKSGCELDARARNGSSATDACSQSAGRDMKLSPEQIQKLDKDYLAYGYAAEFVKNNTDAGKLAWDMQLKFNEAAGDTALQTAIALPIEIATGGLGVGAITGLEVLQLGPTLVKGGWQLTKAAARDLPSDLAFVAKSTAKGGLTEILDSPRWATYAPELGAVRKPILEAGSTASLESVAAAEENLMRAELARAAFKDQIKSNVDLVDDPRLPSFLAAADQQVQDAQRIADAARKSAGSTLDDSVQYDTRVFDARNNFNRAQAAYQAAERSELPVSEIDRLKAQADLAATDLQQARTQATLDRFGSAVDNAPSVRDASAKVEALRAQADLGGEADPLRLATAQTELADARVAAIEDRFGIDLSARREVEPPPPNLFERIAANFGGTSSRTTEPPAQLIPGEPTPIRSQAQLPCAASLPSNFQLVKNVYAQEGAAGSRPCSLFRPGDWKTIANKWLGKNQSTPQQVEEVVTRPQTPAQPVQGEVINPRREAPGDQPQLRALGPGNQSQPVIRVESSDVSTPQGVITQTYQELGELIQTQVSDPQVRAKMQQIADITRGVDEKLARMAEVSGGKFIPAGADAQFQEISALQKELSLSNATVIDRGGIIPAIRKTSPSAGTLQSELPIQTIPHGVVVFPAKANVGETVRLYRGVDDFDIANPQLAAITRDGSITTQDILDYTEGRVSLENLFSKIKNDADRNFILGEIQRAKRAFPDFDDEQILAYVHKDCQRAQNCGSIFVATTNSAQEAFNFAKNGRNGLNGVIVMDVPKSAVAGDLDTIISGGARAGTEQLVIGKVDPGWVRGFIPVDKAMQLADVQDGLKLLDEELAAAKTSPVTQPVPRTIALSPQGITPPQIIGNTFIDSGLQALVDTPVGRIVAEAADTVTEVADNIQTALGLRTVQVTPTAQVVTPRAPLTTAQLSEAVAEKLGRPLSPREVKFTETFLEAQNELEIRNREIAAKLGGTFVPAPVGDVAELAVKATEEFNLIYNGHVGRVNSPSVIRPGEQLLIEESIVVAENGNPIRIDYRERFIDKDGELPPKLIGQVPIFGNNQGYVIVPSPKTASEETVRLYRGVTGFNPDRIETPALIRNGFATQSQVDSFVKGEISAEELLEKHPNRADLLDDIKRVQERAPGMSEQEALFQVHTRCRAEPAYPDACNFSPYLSTAREPAVAQGFSTGFDRLFGTMRLVDDPGLDGPRSVLVLDIPRSELPPFERYAERETPLPASIRPEWIRGVVFSDVGPNYELFKTRLGELEGSLARVDAQVQPRAGVVTEGAMAPCPISALPSSWFNFSFIKEAYAADGSGLSGNPCGRITQAVRSALDTDVGKWIPRSLADSADSLARGLDKLFGGSPSRIVVNANGVTEEIISGWEIFEDGTLVHHGLYKRTVTPQDVTALGDGRLLIQSEGDQFIIDPPKKVSLLDDLRTVGPEKPLGYRTSGHIDQAGSSVDEMAAEALEKGLKVKVFKEGSHIYRGDALFVYDEKALATLLSEKEDILKRAGWPTDTESFVERVATEIAPPKTELYDVIADAFGDYDGLGRLRRTDKNGVLLDDLAKKTAGGDCDVISLKDDVVNLAQANTSSNVLGISTSVSGAEFVGCMILPDPKTKTPLDAFLSAFSEYYPGEIPPRIPENDALVRRMFYPKVATLEADGVYISIGSGIDPLSKIRRGISDKVYLITPGQQLPNNVKLISPEGTEIDLSRMLSPLVVGRNGQVQDILIDGQRYFIGDDAWANPHLFADKAITNPEYKPALDKVISIRQAAIATPADIEATIKSILPDEEFEEITAVLNLVKSNPDFEKLANHRAVDVFELATLPQPARDIFFDNIRDFRGTDLYRQAEELIGKIQAREELTEQEVILAKALQEARVILGPSLYKYSSPKAVSATTERFAIAALAENRVLSQLVSREAYVSHQGSFRGFVDFMRGQGVDLPVWFQAYSPNEFRYGIGLDDVIADSNRNYFIRQRGETADEIAHVLTHEKLHNLHQYASSRLPRSAQVSKYDLVGDPLDAYHEVFTEALTHLFATKGDVAKALVSNSSKNIAYFSGVEELLRILDEVNIHANDPLKGTKLLLEGITGVGESRFTNNLQPLEEYYKSMGKSDLYTRLAPYADPKRLPASSVAVAVPNPKISAVIDGIDLQGDANLIARVNSYKENPAQLLGLSERDPLGIQILNLIENDPEAAIEFRNLVAKAYQDELTQLQAKSIELDQRAARRADGESGEECVLTTMKDDVVNLAQANTSSNVLGVSVGDNYDTMPLWNNPCYFSTRVMEAVKPLPAFVQKPLVTMGKLADDVISPGSDLYISLIRSTEEKAVISLQKEYDKLLSSTHEISTLKVDRWSLERQLPDMSPTERLVAQMQIADIKWQESLLSRQIDDVEARLAQTGKKLSYAEAELEISRDPEIIAAREEFGRLWSERNELEGRGFVKDRVRIKELEAEVEQAFRRKLDLESDKMEEALIARGFDLPAGRQLEEFPNFVDDVQNLEEFVLGEVCELPIAQVRGISVGPSLSDKSTTGKQVLAATAPTASKCPYTRTVQAISNNPLVKFFSTINPFKKTAVVASPPPVNFRELAQKAIDEGLFTRSEEAISFNEANQGLRFPVPITMLDQGHIRVGRNPGPILIGYGQDVPEVVMNAVRKNITAANRLLLPIDQVLSYFHQRFVAQDVFGSKTMSDLVKDARLSFGEYNEDAPSFEIEGVDRRVFAGHGVFTQEEEIAGLELVKRNPEIALAILGYRTVVNDYLAKLGKEFERLSKRPNSGISAEDLSNYQQFADAWTQQDGFNNRLIPALGLHYTIAKQAHPDLSDSEIINQQLFQDSVDFIIANGAFKNYVHVPSYVAADCKPRVNHFLCPAVGTIRQQLLDGSLLNKIYLDTKRQRELGNKSVIRDSETVQKKSTEDITRIQKDAQEELERKTEYDSPVVRISSEGKTLEQLQIEAISKALWDYQGRPAMFKYDGQDFTIPSNGQLSGILDFHQPFQPGDTELKKRERVITDALQNAIQQSLDTNQVVYFSFNSTDYRIDPAKIRQVIQESEQRTDSSPSSPGQAPAARQSE